MHGKIRNSHRTVVEEPEGKRPLLRPGRGCQVLETVGRQCKDWIKLV
jgi:hypothetical protein